MVTICFLTSCARRIDLGRLGLGVMGYGLWVMGYGLWVMGYGLGVMGQGGLEDLAWMKFS